MTDNNAPQDASSTEVPVVIDSLRVSQSERHKVIILLDEAERLYLPIWIGLNEGAVMLSELQDNPHQTCTRFIEQLNEIGTPRKVVVCFLINKVFKSMITLEQEGHETHLGMRPSDSLAVAVRLKLPIFVSQSVMQQAARPAPNFLTKISTHLKVMMINLRDQLSRQKSRS